MLFHHVKRFFRGKTAIIYIANLFFLYIVFRWQNCNSGEVPEFNCTEKEILSNNNNLFAEMFHYPEEEVAKIYSSLYHGKQKKMITKNQNAAIIVPYRNRPLHLSAFLRHMHYFLHSQSVNYRIFIVEQKENQTFNRGKLMNVGFMEALKKGPWNCFIFHDVDLLPENPSNKYVCKKIPTHFSSAIDKFNYTMPYDEYFGGVTAMFRSHFEKLNGFSNEFWGWGGEDDEILMRIKIHKQKYALLSSKLGKYKMIRHVRDKGNDDFKCRHKRINESYNHFHIDGLNNVRYVLLQNQRKYLYTHFLVDLLEEQSKISSSFAC